LLEKFEDSYKVEWAMLVEKSIDQIHKNVDQTKVCELQGQIGDYLNSL